MDELRIGPQPVETMVARQAGYAEWLALGAILAGSIGAVVGAARCRNGRAATNGAESRPEPARVTAPHGDKLSRAL